MGPGRGVLVAPGVGPGVPNGVVEREAVGVGEGSGTVGSTVWAGGGGVATFVERSPRKKLSATTTTMTAARAEPAISASRPQRCGGREVGGRSGGPPKPGPGTPTGPPGGGPKGLPEDPPKGEPGAWGVGPEVPEGEAKGLGWDQGVPPPLDPPDHEPDWPNGFPVG